MVRLTGLLDRLAAALRRPGVVVGALVGAVALVRVLPLAATEDLWFSDDAAYLGAGVRMRLVPVRGAQSPVFCAWYWVTSHVFDSRVQTQYATYLLLGAALGVVVYMLARALGATAGPAVLAALALTATTLPVVRPTIGTFAAVVLGGAVAVAWRWRRRPIFWPVLTAGVALVTWTRPEFLVALVGVVVLSVVAAFVGPGAAHRRRSLLAAGASVLLVVAGWGIFGSPVGGARQWVAYCQHEGFARSLLGDTRVNSAWHGWAETCRSTYGTDNTIGAAIVHHPGAVAAHVGRSLRLLPRSLADALVPSSRLAVVVAVAGIAAVAGLLAGATIVAVRRRRRVRGWLRSTGPPVWALAVLLVPNVVSIVLIHPRSHYVAVPAVLVLGAAAAVASRAHSGAGSSVVVVATGVLAVLIVGAAIVQASDPPRSRPALESVAALQHRADVDGLDRVASMGAKMTGYLKGVVPVDLPFVAPDDPAAWLAERRVDGVVVAPDDRDLAERGPYAAFLRHPERFGWRRVDLVGPYRLLVPERADG